MQQLKVCILGGAGFVGRSIAAQLAAQKHAIKVLTRHRERNRDMLVLPTLVLTECDIHQPEVLAEQFQGIDVVINLVGILNESGHRGRGFVKAHVELAETVVKAMHASGVQRLLHMSALNVDPDGPSHYLRSKGLAENLVHERGRQYGLRPTSFRPSVIFGPLDSFTNRFADLLKQIPFVFPLACPDARFQPVHVEDVARCFISAIDDHDSVDCRYDLCGPTVYTLEEVVNYLQSVLGTNKKVIRLADWQARLQAAIMEWAPGKPFSKDNYNSLSVDSVCRGESPAPYLEQPQSMESIAPTYLRKHSSRFDALRKIARR